MIVIDSTVWIDYFRDLNTAHTEWLHRHAYDEDLAMTGLVLCEVLQGARDKSEFAAIKSMLLALHSIPGDTPALAVKSAENYRTLRSRGLTVRKIADTMIATACIEQGHWLLHNDRDFDAFEKHLGLKVIHP